jgi:hypothetical protein
MITRFILERKRFALNTLIFETLSESWAKLTHASNNTSLALHYIIEISRKRRVALKHLSFWRSKSWAKLTNASRNASLALNNIIEIRRRRHVALKCLSFWRSGIKNSLSKRVKKSKVWKRDTWMHIYLLKYQGSIKYENQRKFDVFLIMYELYAQYETGPRSAATFRSTSCSLL